VQPVPPDVRVTVATDVLAFAVAPCPAPPEKPTVGAVVQPTPGVATVTDPTDTPDSVAVPVGSVEQPPPVNVTVGADVYAVPPAVMATTNWPESVAVAAGFVVHPLPQVNVGTLV
jgi:hypothetical protein